MGSYLDELGSTIREYETQRGDRVIKVEKGVAKIEVRPRREVRVCHNVLRDYMDSAVD